MAQSSSAQRDPSMEEILASIRKIIEEGEEPQVARSLPRVDYEPAAIGPAANDVARPKVSDYLPEEMEPVASAAQPELRGAIEDYETPADFGTVETDLIRSANVSVKEPTLEDFDVDMGSVETQPASPAPTVHSTILSRQTERQVAASFSELSEAFAASRQRSLEQAADEMLRPMLQDWLDSNLPALVERLVREEIERLAKASA